MINAGYQLQNVAENRDVSMFTFTSIECVPVGPFACPIVVSMSPIPKDLVGNLVVVYCTRPHKLSAFTYIVYK